MKSIGRGFRRFVTVGLSLLLIAVPCVIFGVLKETGERELFIAYLGQRKPLRKRR